MEHDRSSQLVADSHSEAAADDVLQRVNADPAASLFKLSPLIRLTLLLLYVSLTLPLPFLAEMTAAAVPSPFLWVGIGLGGILLYAALSERVVLNSDGIQVTYAAWVPRFFRRGWVATVGRRDGIEAPFDWARWSSLLFRESIWRGISFANAGGWFQPYGAASAGGNEP